MLNSMSIMQYMEWQAFFRIREEERAKEKGQAAGGKPGTAPAPNEKFLQAKITGGFEAAMRRRQKAGGRGR